MPLLLGIVASGTSVADVPVPREAIAATLAFMLVPLGAGMAIARKRPALARRIERAGSVTGVAMLVFLLAVSAYRYVGFLRAATPGMWR